jgi:hypothetical protein
MSSANAVRRLRSALPVQRRNAKAPSYIVGSAVAVGALAAIALVNRHLAKKRSVTIPLPAASSTSTAFGSTTLNGAWVSRSFFSTAMAA